MAAERGGGTADGGEGGIICRTTDAVGLGLTQFFLRCRMGGGEKKIAFMLLLGALGIAFLGFRYCFLGLSVLLFGEKSVFLEEKCILICIYEKKSLSLHT